VRLANHVDASLVAVWTKSRFVPADACGKTVVWLCFQESSSLAGERDKVSLSGPFPANRIASL
jgi:hypothetical protein